MFHDRKIRLWAVLFWLLVWQLGSIAVGSDILLVSPLQVLARLFELIREKSFWAAILYSALRIAAGFLLGTTAGTVLAALAARFRRVDELLAPLILTIKTIPVASFIILVLIWFTSVHLSVVISFLMVMPILYTNVREGIDSVDDDLLEMASLFRIPAGRRVRYIYITQVMPFFRTGCTLALGLCWKSGIAAELIGVPSGSIGELLYRSKIYLETPDLFAWTLVIVLISLAFEKLTLKAVDLAAAFLERM